LYAALLIVAESIIYIYIVAKSEKSGTLLSPRGAVSLFKKAIGGSRRRNASDGSSSQPTDTSTTTTTTTTTTASATTTTTTTTTATTDDNDNPNPAVFVPIEATIDHNAAPKRTPSTAPDGTKKIQIVATQSPPANTPAPADVDAKLLPPKSTPSLKGIDCFCVYCSCWLLLTS
jgi:hypothetical protein